MVFAGELKLGIKAKIDIDDTEIHTRAASELNIALDSLTAVQIIKWRTENIDIANQKFLEWRKLNNTAVYAIRSTIDLRIDDRFCDLSIAADINAKLRDMHEKSVADTWQSKIDALYDVAFIPSILPSEFSSNRDRVVFNC